MSPVLTAPPASGTAGFAPGIGLDFVLPHGLEASEPPEARGLARDQVRLMVGWRHRPGLAHTTFRHLPDYLEAGDLLVVNNSATLPAALDALADDGTALELHLSTRLEADLWVVEPRLASTAAMTPTAGNGLGDRSTAYVGSAAGFSGAPWRAAGTATAGNGLGGRSTAGVGSAARLSAAEAGSAAAAEAGSAEAGNGASRPFPGAHAGMVIELPGAGRVELLTSYGTPGRLWVAALHLPIPVDEWLARHGRPIRYHYVRSDWPLDYYQTVFAQEAGSSGSAEMPSAARPFSAALVTDLVSRGVGVAPITLHCGVSSLESHEAPMAEWFNVAPSTSDLVNQTRRRGGRVIAVGTTVVRALETAADDQGEVRPARGWTDLVITAAHPVRAVDGMITGWHEPRASHLAMLEAVAGTELLTRSYQAALACGYRWHEFGDSHLILP